MTDDEAKNEAESLTDEVLSILTHYTAVASGRKAALIIGVKVEPDDVVKQILVLYNQHCSFPEIARQLNKAGMKGKDGRNPLGPPGHLSAGLWFLSGTRA